MVIQDGNLTTGVENYKEFFQSLVGLTGESQNFDGNGSYTRFQTGGGGTTVATDPVGSAGPLFANAVRAAARHPPGAAPPSRPPYRRDRGLLQAEAARPERRQDRSGPVRRQIRKYLRDFLAIIFMILVAAGVAGYILSNQRFYLPAWVPVVGTDFYELKAELGTAQAVVPGQGQTVNIAGVKVGDIGSVKLEDGRAVVEMKIRRKYAPIYKDATILLRPKTGLKDMFLELDPGTKARREVRGGRRIPVANTLPDVNPDEILASLDGDTRDYLRILLNAGAEGLEDDAPAELRETFKRFEPTSRDAQDQAKSL